MLTLENNRGMKVVLTETGGAIQSILVPDRNGKPGDVVLGWKRRLSILRRAAWERWLAAMQTGSPAPPFP